MSTETKISPAFKPFLTDVDVDDKREAIVIYQAPQIEGLPLRGRLRELKRRLDEVKQQAAIQKVVEEKLFDNYQKTTWDLGYRDRPLAVSSIGYDTLPVATVEVTRKSLPA